MRSSVCDPVTPWPDTQPAAPDGDEDGVREPSARAQAQALLAGAAAAAGRLPRDARPPATGPAPGPTALALYAQVLGARSVQAAAQRLVVSLAASAACSRVILALHDEGRTRLLVQSQGELRDLEGDVAPLLLGALDEAIDQGCSVAWPAPVANTKAGAPAPGPITLEHKALQAVCGGCIASVPLGRDGASIAAVLLQRDQGPAFADQELLQIQHLLQLAAPALHWMMLGGQPWLRRTRRDLQQAWAALRQPDRRTTRRLLLGAAALLAFLALAPLPHTVAGRARVEGAEQRVLVAPTDGFVKTAHVRPGDRVLAGAPLLDLLEQDLRLERERWSSQLAQHENAYAAAMARADRVGAATAMARVSEAQSQLSLVDGQLARGRLEAPFDGLVIQGDFSQAIGAPVRQGDTLITLASTAQYRVIVDVDETDIARVQPGQDGRLALSSLSGLLPWPGDESALVVERIAPIAKVVDGRNVFEVEARLLQPPQALRPGLLGRARLVVGHRPPLWVWLQQAGNRLRMAWWSWLG
jgi:hypothetical protein